MPHARFCMACGLERPQDAAAKPATAATAAMAAAGPPAAPPAQPALATPATPPTPAVPPVAPAAPTAPPAQASPPLPAQPAPAAPPAQLAQPAPPVHPGHPAPPAPAAQPAPPAQPTPALTGAFAPLAAQAQATVPGEQRSTRRKVVLWVAVGLAAFLVGGAATAGVMLTRGDAGSDGKRKHPAPASSSGPSGSAGPAAPVTIPDRAKAQPPAGYERMTSPEGFTLAVPEGWHRENKGSNQIDYAGPTGLAHLRVGITVHSTQSVSDHFLEMEKVVSKQDGYKRVQFTENTFQGRPGALWEWTYTEQYTGRTIHAIDQAYLDEKGNELAVLFEDREEYWSETHKVFDTALAYWWCGATDFE
ncbi:hypothetical protein FHS39_003520 [Streptomyces olivoverticillatus]|uniref:Serine/threonine protein kinase n=1 Tax=Streptomyces olivoverticillatus TaxID=66427 RepID=A0A7W7LQJ2_9ACTN|nr:hypothetical protein [Streptomyces olivoverticillatus]MBB4894462.1 hypothetical protein [Streptomyces olivoverticillatus]